MQIRIGLSTPVLLAASMLATASMASAQLDPNYTFTKVADTTMAAPGGQGTFLSMGQIALDEQGNFAFRGSDHAGPRVYVGPITNPAAMLPRYSVGDPAPDAASIFVDISSPTISQGKVAFRAMASNGIHGIYSDQDGPLVRAADTNTLIPSGWGRFTAFSQPWLWDDVLVFRGIGQDGQDGIYAFDGTTLRMVADGGTFMPSVFPFRTFDSFGTLPVSPGFYDWLPGTPAFDNGMIVFYGKGPTRQGIYREINGSLQRIADTTTAIPSGTGNFTSFDGSELAANVCGNMIAFHGKGTNQAGIYKWLNGALSVVVNTSTTIPGKAVPFTNFGTQGYGLDVGNSAFLGSGAGGGTLQAVYHSKSGVLRRVAGNGDILMGQSLTALGTYGRSLEGPYVGFNVSSYGSPGANAIFIAKYIGP